MSLNGDKILGRAMKPSFLVISRHDYRSPRKANVHFIASELRKYGSVRFFSLGYSHLSRFNNDPRQSLDRRANIVGEHDGIECYLWKSAFHPFNLKRDGLRIVERALFKAFLWGVPEILKEWIRGADYVLLESGIPVILFDLVRSANPSALLTYLASDDVRTIGCAKYIEEVLERTLACYDRVRLPSRQLASAMPQGTRAYFIPHGVDPTILAHADPSPYAGGINIVSVGSMLFDRTFFDVAAKAFPNVTFHIIGGGADAVGIVDANIRVYGEMPFLNTIPYIKHANAGVAPYRQGEVSPYLADTSMKLLQYSFLGIPAICPQAVVEGYEGRFGYVSDSESIVSAVSRALRCSVSSRGSVLTWADVTSRLLAPERYEDTCIASHASKLATLGL